FRGRINAAIRQSHIAGNRGNIDYKSRFLGTHLWQDGFHDLDWAIEIGFEMVPDFGCRDFFDRAQDTNTGIVDQDVNLPGNLDHFVYRVFYACSLTYVERHEWKNRIFNFFRISASAVDGKALVEKVLANCFAKPRRCAGNQDDFHWLNLKLTQKRDGKPRPRFGCQI